MMQASEQQPSRRRSRCRYRTALRPHTLTALQRTNGTTHAVHGTGGLGRAGAKPFALSQPTT